MVTNKQEMIDDMQEDLYPNFSSKFRYKFIKIDISLMGFCYYRSYTSYEHEIFKHCRECKLAALALFRDISSNNASFKMTITGFKEDYKSEVISTMKFVKYNKERILSISSLEFYRLGHEIHDIYNNVS